MMSRTAIRAHSRRPHIGVALASMALTGIVGLALTLACGPVPIQAQAGCQELMINAGFENGRDGWVEYSSENYELIDPFHPHTGVKSAWLVASNNEEAWIAQTVALPTGAGSLKLGYWWSLFTEENPGGAFDFLRVQLLRVDNTLITTLAVYHNDSAEAWLWNPGSIDLTPYAGQTIQVRFYAKTDANNPTSFFVDDVSLLACAEKNTPTPTPRARIFLPLILR